MSDGLACKPPRDKTPSVRPGRAATSLAVMWPSQKEEEVSVQEALAEGNECFCVCVCACACVCTCACACPCLVACLPREMSLVSLGISCIHIMPISGAHFSLFFLF